MQQSIDKFFIEAASYLGGLEPKKIALMKRIYSKICKDFNINVEDKSRRESLALLILCYTKDDESEDDVYDFAHKWMSFIASLKSA